MNDDQGFEQSISMSPAFSKRDTNPAKDYGIGSVRIHFVLKGPLGATQFIIGTDWYLPEDQKRLRASASILDDRVQPGGWDIGYHSPHPQYEGQAVMEGSCEYLNGQPCYYDGTSLGAEEFIPTFLAGGSDAVWKMLRERYDTLFPSSAVQS